jgi:cell division protein YceG involved in septum cleavage
LARGDRSRQGRERTAEERERDREERARQRALREAAAPLAETGLPPFEPPAAEGAVEADSAPTLHEDPHEDAGAEEHAPDIAAGPADLYSDHSPAHDPPYEHAGSELTPAEPAPGESAGDPHDVGEPIAPRVAPEEATTARYSAAEGAAAAHHAAQEEAAAAPEQAQAAAARLEPEPPPQHPAEQQEPEQQREQELAGSLPPLPPAASSRRLRRSRAEGLPAVAGASRPRRRARSPRALLGRAGAVIALGAVIFAVVLLVRSLTSSKHSASTTVPVAVRVVIPEGLTRVQIAALAAKDGLRGSYRAASKRSPLLDPTHYGAPHSTPDLEGFLFPATYDEYPGAPVTRLVDEQLVAFKENFGASLSARARALHVTPYQLLIVASMIEREAQVPGDRAKIAAVIYNRLAQGIPLGIDATIYYAVELEKGVATYTQELTESQLHINSPYNTRIHVGLPPTPISNPGLASIEAAAHPVHVPYLYYVAGADGCGEHVFSTTLAAFEANAAAYQAAVKKNGGKPPTCKKK